MQYNNVKHLHLHCNVHKNFWIYTNLQNKTMFMGIKVKI
jgi:hypothetical protein